MADIITMPVIRIERQEDDSKELRVLARLAWNNWPDTPDSRREIAAHEAKDQYSAEAWDRVIAAFHKSIYDTLLVEMWSGDRKIVVYPDIVLRVWGPDMENEMSEEPRNIDSVQAAFEWLKAPSPPSQNGKTP